MNYCTIFEQQLWRKDRCRHCFKLESEHSLVRTQSQDILLIKQQQQQQQQSNNNNITPVKQQQQTNNNNNTPNQSKPINYNKYRGVNSSVTTTNSYGTPDRSLPSVDRAPLSIRRTLTPQAIETFSKRISAQSNSPLSSPLSSPSQTTTIVSTTVNTSTTIGGGITISSPIPLAVPFKSKPPPSPKRYPTLPASATAPSTPIPIRSSNNSSVLSPLSTVGGGGGSPSTPSSGITNKMIQIFNSSKTTPSSGLSKQLNESNDRSNGGGSSDDANDESEATRQQITRQSRSQSDITPSSPTPPIVIPCPSTPNMEKKKKPSSFFIPNASLNPSNQSSPLPTYQQKHAQRHNDSISTPLGSSPMKPLFHSSMSSIQSSSSANSTPTSSTSSLSSLVPKDSNTNNNNNNHTPMGHRKYTIAKGLIKLNKKNNDLKKSNNNSLKRSNIANWVDTNNDMFKIFGAVQSTLIAIPGIAPSVVMNIMDILYNQQLDINFHTYVSTPYLDGLHNAMSTLQTWSLAQDYVKDVIVVQSCVRRFLAKRRVEWLTSAYSRSLLRERNVAFRMLILEERRYNTNLQIVLQHYHKPLRAAQLITDDDFKAIFSSIEEIQMVHQRILMQFEQLFDKWPCVEGLGDIFLRIAPDLKVYGSYVKNFKNAIDTLERCRNDNPKFAQFIDDCCQQTPGQVYDLMALVATPLNHLSMYQRQLFTIANHTPSHWPDYVNIINSEKMMKEVEQLVQDNLAQAQNAASLLNIYRKINNKKALDPFVIPGRTYLHEGKLIKFEVKKQDQLYFYFLCNDIMLFTKRYQKDQLKYKNLFNINDIVVSDLPDTANHKHVITISRKGSSSAKDTMSFSVEDPEEKRGLLKQFSNLSSATVNNSTKIFGTSIIDLVQREGEKVLIPIFIIKAANVLLNYLTIEGIFRVSPSQMEVDTLKDSLNKCQPANIEMVVGKGGPHHIAAVIKAFFREMAPPLFTYELYDRIIAVGDSREMDVKEQISQVRSMLQGIPACNQATLQLILLLLCTIGQQSDKNKMNHSNLSIVFGPNLIKPHHQTIETSLKIPIINNLISIMLDHYNLLYCDRLNLVRIIDNKFIVSN